MYAESVYSENDELILKSPILERLLRKVVTDGASDTLDIVIDHDVSMNGEIKES